mgnify:CR=1 FL=1
MSITACLPLGRFLMQTIDWEPLRTAAAEAARAAHCPYSGFHVGAAVLAAGRIYAGCNVENASYGLTICAERGAICAAVAAGHKRIDAVYVLCSDAAEESSAAQRMPCGACRQVLAEFGAPTLPVYVAGVGELTLDELLPNAFRLD